MNCFFASAKIQPRLKANKNAFRVAAFGFTTPESVS
jgi:hypothetical protein